MDFYTSHDGPVTIRIDGKAYQAPRFLMPEHTEWASIRKQQIIDEATAHLDPMTKARFLAFNYAPPIDMVDQMDLAKSPEEGGAWYVVNRQLEAAGVPADIREKVRVSNDPNNICALAMELTTARRVRASQQAADENGEKKDPLTDTQGESGGSAEIGSGSAPPSTTPTASTSDA